MIRFVPDENNSAATGAYGEGAVKYSVDGDQSGAGVVFKVSGNDCFVFEITGSIPVITEGLIRSALNYAANRGAYTARITAAAQGDNGAVLSRLGFKDENGALTADIPDVLTCACGCGCKN